MTSPATSVASPPSKPGAKGSRRRPSAETFAERFGLLIVWAVVIIVFSILRPSTFATTANFQTIFGSQSVLLMLTIGLVVVLNAGEFDLSPAAGLGFGAMFLACLNVNQGWPIGLAILVVMLGGLLFGLFNAFLIVKLRVPTVVATLGSGTLLVGLTSALSGQIVFGVSPGFVSFVRTNFLGLPLAFYIALALCLVLHYVLQYTPFGRYLIFVGSGREVARLAGVRVDRMRVAALVAVSVIAFGAGVVLVGLNGSADPIAGPDLLLPAFAAAFLGQTSIYPGRLNVPGSFIAIYFLVTGITGLQFIGVADWVEQVFYGGALIVGVAAAQIVVRQRRAAV